MSYRIGIDCRLAGHRHAGIGRYITQLVSHLPHTKEVKWVVFYAQRDQVAELFPQGTPDTVELVEANIPHYSLKEQRVLPGIFSTAHLDLLHVPHFNVPLRYKGKFVTTIHDLLWHERKGLAVTTLNPVMYLIKYGAYRLVARHAITQAAAVITPSQVVADTVGLLFPKAQNSTVVTYEGVEEAWLKIGEAHLKTGIKPTLKRPSYLYVGSLYPHKNVSCLLKALPLLPGRRLVIATARSAFSDKLQRQIKSLELNSRVELQFGVSDARLRQLYAEATALVQPSLSEGFGLTGLEAMALGKRVVASDIPIFHEIYKSHAEYFDPRSPQDLAATLERVEQTPVTTLTKQLKKAHTHAGSYSWQTMAEETYQIYLTALSN